MRIKKNTKHFSYVKITSNFKGALCSFGKEIQTQNFHIYSINVVKTQTQIYLFSIRKIPRTLFEARKVARSASHKQSITV